MKWTSTSRNWGSRCVSRRRILPFLFRWAFFFLVLLLPSIFLFFEPVLFLDNRAFQQLSCGWIAQISGPIKTSYQTDDLFYSGSFRDCNRNELIIYLLPLLSASHLWNSWVKPPNNKIKGVCGLLLCLIELPSCLKKRKKKKKSPGSWNSYCLPSPEIRILKRWNITGITSDSNTWRAEKVSIKKKLLFDKYVLKSTCYIPVL